MATKICKARWTSKSQYGPYGYEIQVEYTNKSKPDAGDIRRALEKAGQKNASQWSIQSTYWEFIF